MDYVIINVNTNKYFKNKDESFTSNIDDAYKFENLTDAIVAITCDCNDPHMLRIVSN